LINMTNFGYNKVHVRSNNLQNKARVSIKLTFQAYLYTLTTAFVTS